MGTIPEHERFRLHKIKGPLFEQAVEVEINLLTICVRSLWRGRPLWSTATSPPVSKPKCNNGGKREQEHFSAENKSLSSNCSHGDRKLLTCSVETQL
jgi:hypothetical protein